MLGPLHVFSTRRARAVVFHPVPAAGVGAAGQRAWLSCRRAHGSIRHQASATSRLEESRKGQRCPQGSPCQGSRDLPVPWLCTLGSGEGGPGAQRDSCRDTNRLQKRGVIWRGSSGRMLMESSARPQSRHSMVYSCGGTGGGELPQPCLPQPSSPAGKPEPEPAPDPQLQPDLEGISFRPPGRAPSAPLSPFSSA